jgi:(E)-4-hydroxy-3-methylbut-2-enyl-diphosphate synthase
MKRGEIIAKLSGDALINRFIEEVEFEAEKRK